MFDDLLCTGEKGDLFGDFKLPSEEECKGLHQRVVAEEGDTQVPGLERDTDYEKAIRLLEYALTLRMYGECAPGGTETWRAFDRSAEEFLRRIHGLEDK